MKAASLRELSNVIYYKQNGPIPTVVFFWLWQHTEVQARSGPRTTC
jgi:hypothetical protein